VLTSRDRWTQFSPSDSLSTVVPRVAGVFVFGIGRVCRQKPSQYGLMQAPRCWNKRFISLMEKAGLKNSTADTCLFYRTHEDSFLYIALYVDDGLVIVNKDEEIEVFLGLLQEEFKITIGSL
jgi:hypothetical protein